MLRENTSKSHRFRLAFEVVNPCQPRLSKLCQSHSLDHPSLPLSYAKYVEGEVVYFLKSYDIWFGA